MTAEIVEALKVSRKHFRELADALRFCKPLPEMGGCYQAALAQWERDVRNVADACRYFNSNFDRLGFYRAAGMDGDR